MYSIGPYAEHQNKSRRGFFHQTNPINAASILRSQNMTPGVDGSYGSAIYFARTAPDTHRKARQHGTILFSDVYLGRTKKEVNLNNDHSCDSTIIKRFNGDEFAVRNSNRVRNIRYYDGDPPYNFNYVIEMRPRITLFFATTASKARDCKNRRRLIEEIRPYIAGKGFYLWENAKDARKYALDTPETILAADVFFTNPYQNRNSMPSQFDIRKYDSFRGNFKNTHYFMVKNERRIQRIHYVDGIEI